jgi:hypothetical protein
VIDKNEILNQMGEGLDNQIEPFVATDIQADHKWRDGHVVGFVANINPRCFRMHNFQIQAPVSGLIHSLLLMLGVHGLMLLPDLAASGPVAIGL